MEVQGIIPLAAPEDQVRTDMGILASAMQDDNPTFAALRAAFPPIQGSAPLKVVPFSSARKWSGARFEKLGSLVLGAGEFVLGADYPSIRGRVASGCWCWPKAIRIFRENRACPRA